MLREMNREEMRAVTGTRNVCTESVRYGRHKESVKEERTKHRKPNDKTDMHTTVRN